MAETTKEIYEYDVLLDDSSMTCMGQDGLVFVRENYADEGQYFAWEPGVRMPDGSVCAGISPEKKTPIYATSSDAPLRQTFEQALGYADNLSAHGHDDWRPPSDTELDVMCENEAAIGGFSEDWHWAAKQRTSFSAACQRFPDGKKSEHGTGMVQALRCVRD